MRRVLLVLVLLSPVLLVSMLLAGPARAGTWVWPLAGPPSVERGFDPPASAYGAGHRGVDLRGTAGQPVRSAGAGRVSFAGVVAGRGVVTVSHAAGLRTTYEPVFAVVRMGQPVAAGDVLGTLVVGHCRDGRACLHWGLLRGSRYLNPLSLLQATAIRLLPLGGQPTSSGPAGPSAAGPNSVLSGTPLAGTALPGTAPADSAAAGRQAGGTLAGRAAPAGAAPVAAAATGPGPAPAAGRARAGPERSVPAPARAGPAPQFALRGADRALGVGALLLLALGLAVIVRRPAPAPPRARPTLGTAVSGDSGRDGRAVTDVPGTAVPIDLEHERARRRTGEAGPSSRDSGRHN